MRIGGRATILRPPQARVEAVRGSKPNITVAVAVVVTHAVAITVTHGHLEVGNRHATLVNAHLYKST